MKRLDPVLPGDHVPAVLQAWPPPDVLEQVAVHLTFYTPASARANGTQQRGRNHHKP